MAGVAVFEHNGAVGHTSKRLYSSPVDLSGLAATTSEGALVWSRECEVYERK